MSAFDDGQAFSLPAELLRVTSPSAEVQGHSEAQRKTVGGKRNVTILSVDPVGNYAVRLGFDDMHSTGIYSWAFLRDLGVNAERRFQDYLDDLARQGPRSRQTGHALRRAARDTLRATPPLTAARTDETIAANARSPPKTPVSHF